MPASDMNQITLLLVDDHEIWRGGVKSMLEETEFEVVGEAASSKEALEIAREVHPQLTLLDIRMLGGDGLDALVMLKQEHPAMAVIMLTTYENPTLVARAVAGGAAGYLLKGIEREEMLSALRTVADGHDLFTSQDLMRSLRSISDAASGSPDLFEPLTDREEEVLCLLATGLNNRDIGEILFIADSTVKTHVIHILGKLGVSDRVQAAVWATRQGLCADNLTEAFPSGTETQGRTPVASTMQRQCA